MRNSAENHYDILSPYAPQMPKPVPQMLHLAIKNAPEHMKAAISNSLFPAFGSLMHNVGFRYSDNVFHEPHFMCRLIVPERYPFLSKDMQFSNSANRRVSQRA